MSLKEDEEENQGQLLWDHLQKIKLKLMKLWVNIQSSANYRYTKTEGNKFSFNFSAIDF